MNTGIIAARFCPPRSLRVSCPNCAFSEWALPGLLTSAGAGHFNEHIVHCRSVKRRDYVHRSGAALASLNVVNSGFLKTCVTGRNGNVQVTGFSMRGTWSGSMRSASVFISAIRLRLKTPACAVSSTHVSSN
jgi:hypothetical protein